MSEDPRARAHPETAAAQALHGFEPDGGAVVPPLQASTTFVRDADNRLLGGDLYQRPDSPGLRPAENLLAHLEGGAEGLLFSSGMAAAAAVLQAVRPGDHVVAPRVMYWALRNWMVGFCRDWGVGLDLVDMAAPDALAAAVRPGETKLVWVETPVNPTWDVVDIARAAEIARGAGAVLAVDSTAATPVHSQPLALGADIVHHSATKYLNGHSDLLAGGLVTDDPDSWIWQRVRENRAKGGAMLGAFEGWLLLRGMRTLYLRVHRASESALKIACHFEGHPHVARVLYPGLTRHPGHAVARGQMRDGFGGMLSLRVSGGREAALRTCGACRLFLRATSLGGVESLIEHRASIEGPDSPVPDDLLRVSVGIEHPEDLIADLEQALAQA